MIPVKEVSSNSKPIWINRIIKRLSRKKQKLYNKARASKTPNDWSIYQAVKRKLQQECQKAHNKYINNLINTEDGPTSKKLWHFIKEQKQDYCGIAPLEDKGTIYNDPQSKADILNNFFGSVFTLEDESPLPEMITDPVPDMAPIQMHEKGVLHLLLQLKQCKSTGPDEIPARFLKEFAHQLAPLLTVLYQASINQGSIPEDWKIAKVTPIFKKGNKSNPSNYRPVSLTSICCKVLEHIIYSSVSHHLTQYNILRTEQHGFRSGRSCESQLLITIHDLAQNLDEGKQTDVILLDFTKAFDKVPHNRLCYKLSLYGIRGSLLLWIKNFLTGRTQQVVVNGHISDHTEVTSGVPQDSVIAPLLFLLYINNLPDNITSTVKIYADDVLLYRSIDSIQDSIALQQDLNTLQDWANKWLMVFNPSKYELIHITNKRNRQLSDYYIQNTLIKANSQVKYLGVTIDQHLTFNDHIKA